jgi:hypothetical protein
MTTHDPRHARSVTTPSPGVGTFGDAVVDGVDVDAVAAAVRTCPGVDGLRGGGPGEVATYLPGRRIVGVQVTPAGLVVAVRGRWGVSAAALAGQIRSVVAALAPGRPVEVRLVEVADPPGPPTAEQSQLWEPDDRGEQGLRRESDRQPGGVQRTVMDSSDGDRLERSTDWAQPATSTTGDTLAPVLAAWGQVYTSMFELAGDMMKLQQQTFASMMGFADTNAERIASGDQRGRVHDALSASRTSSVGPDQIDQHRR